jgi:hypothetical protein
MVSNTSSSCTTAFRVHRVTVWANLKISSAGSRCQDRYGAAFLCARAARQTEVRDTTDASVRRSSRSSAGNRMPRMSSAPAGPCEPSLEHATAVGTWPPLLRCTAIPPQMACIEFTARLLKRLGEISGTTRVFCTCWPYRRPIPWSPRSPHWIKPMHCCNNATTERRRTPRSGTSPRIRGAIGLTSS